MSAERKIGRIQTLTEKKKWDKIIKKFADSKDPAVRAAACEAMGKFFVDETYNKLVLLSRDDDLSVKKAAVRALGELGRKAGADHVRFAMEHTTDADLIQECQTAVTKIVNSDKR